MCTFMFVCMCIYMHVWYYECMHTCVSVREYTCTHKPMPPWRAVMGALTLPANPAGIEPRALWVLHVVVHKLTTLATH